MFLITPHSSDQRGNVAMIVAFSNAGNVFESLFQFSTSVCVPLLVSLCFSYTTHTTGPDHTHSHKSDVTNTFFQCLNTHLFLKSEEKNNISELLLFALFSP